MSPIYEEQYSPVKDALPDKATLFSRSDIDINTIYYEISGICNAKCTYCPTGSGVTKGRPARFIPPEEFSRGLNRLYELSLLTNDVFFGLFNWGDPLLHPQLNEILHILKEADQSFALSTNGSFIPKNLNSSLLDNLSYIRFSLPGFSQKSYDKIHRLDFEKVLQNIGILNELVPPDTLEVLLYAYKFNTGEISRAFEYFSNKNIRFQVGMPHLMDYEDAVGYLTETIDPVKKQGIEDDLFTDHIKSLLLYKEDKKSCPYLQNQLVIDEYNNVLTCCVLSKNSEYYTVGSLFELTKDEIFDVKTRGQPICSRCMSAGVPYWYEFNCRHLPQELQAFNTQTYCYIDTGYGFSEKQKVSSNVNSRASRAPFHAFFDLRGFNDIKALRWDPVEGRLCHISIDKIQVEMKNGDVRLVEPENLTTNGEHISDNELRFDTIDPWFVIPAEGQINNVVITGSWLVKDVDETIPHLNQEIVQSNMKIQSLQQTITDHDAQVALLDEQVEQLTEETQSLQGTISERDAQIAPLNERIKQQAAQLMRLSNELASIKQSIVWRLLMKYHNGFVERILPQNTKRRALYDRVLKGGRIIINDGWGNFWSTYSAYKSSKKHPSSISESVEEKILKDPESGKEANCVSSDTSAIKCKLSGFLSQPYLMLKFPKFENPVVSLVILTFNKAAITYQCLESLLAHTDVPYELILVDNGSTDETLSLLDRLENVIIIRNSDNLGFVLGCNKGAKMAKGEHLLFLNNDTVVTPNWLSHLVRTIESYPKCGAVGCKLVWPNGLLQEAGSIIWSDGSALGYGRGDNPFKSEYSYLREVDYCSGACLLVRKDLFWAVGGFDELYAPAYYEDSDLCLGIQKLGYKVVFQPAVTVFHHEFTSSTPDKARELMMDNQGKFLAKRKDLLYYKESPSLDNVFIARDTRKEKTVLVLDDRIPVPGQGSGYPRANELLRFLGELGYKITLFPLDNTTPWQPHTFEFQQLGIEVFYGGNLDFNKFAQERLGYYDIVIVSRPHNLEKTYDTIKACFSNAYLIYDAEAMFSVREILKAKSQGVMLSEGRTKAMMGKEICLMKKADMVTTVSENEKQLIVKKSGLRNVMVIGHSINTQDYNSDFNARKDVLFVGGFLASNGPNDDAVLYFVKEIWPRVQKSLSCKFYIVGINPPDSVKNLASSSVIVTGFVPDLQEYYDKCRLFVVPHRYAAGIPWKLQEAMSCGIPSVVSELMASQLNLQDGKEVLVASNPDEFADKIIELYQNEDLWRQLQMNAIKYIETECSPLKIKNTLKTIMDKTEESR